MKVLKNKILHSIPVMTQKIDSTDDLPYIPTDPLPKSKSNAFYIVGHAGSGKSSLMMALLTSRPTKKNKDKPRFFYRWYDRIYLISPSNSTLDLDKLKLNENRIYDKYTDELMTEIIETEKEGDNLNNLVLLDDSIRDITKSKIMNKLILNRRHATHNKSKENTSGLSVWILSQKYNMLQLSFRSNMSDIILFKTENRKELNAIKDELMSDLTPEEQNAVLKEVWSKKYGFLYIKANNPKKDRYYSKFDKIVFDEPEEEKENDNTKEE